MRIGFICTDDPEDPFRLSGTPHAVMRAFERAGAEIEVLRPPTQTGGEPPAMRRERSFMKRALSRAPGKAARLHDGMLQQSLRAAADVHSRARRAAAAGELDVLFGCFASPLL